MADRYTLERDLNEAEAMAKALDPYVREDQLYGNASGGGFFAAGRMPSLTVGALLMRIRRLNALRDQLNESQRERLEAVETRNRDVHREWTMHYEQKMQREAHSRLDAMNTFFEECQNDPRLCARVYGPEASRRTIVQELLMAMDTLNIDPGEELRNKTKSTDSRLRRYVDSSEFIWDTTLRPAYPAGPFWWLYAQPPLPEN